MIQPKFCNFLDQWRVISHRHEYIKYTLTRGVLWTENISKSAKRRIIRRVGQKLYDVINGWPLPWPTALLAVTAMTIVHDVIVPSAAKVDPHFNLFTTPVRTLHESVIGRLYKIFNHWKTYYYLFLCILVSLSIDFSGVWLPKGQSVHVLLLLTAPTPIQLCFHVKCVYWQHKYKCGYINIPLVRFNTYSYNYFNYKS